MNQSINKYRIIDAHSHIGIGLNMINATLDEYVKLKEQSNICFSLIMPQPILDKTIIRNEQLFDDLNDHTYFEIIKSGKDDISFVPMISPIYTSPLNLEKYIEKYNPLALKIHMKNDNSNPDMICDEWIKILKKHNIPIIVHTDYSKNNDNEKDMLKNMNSSLRWLNFFKKHEIKGYLTHGARINKMVLEQINHTENIIIGIGPDLLLQLFSNNGLEQETSYLKVLYDYVDANKLAFDIDYNWNVDENGNLDYDAISRIEKYWNYEQCKEIFYSNSYNFFNIKKSLRR